MPPVCVCACFYVHACGKVVYFACQARQQSRSRHVSMARVHVSMARVHVSMARVHVSMARVHASMGRVHG